MAFGVYLHFPYCLSKCPYCDFASVAGTPIPHERYARAVARELELRLEAARGRRALSLYVGGGTPSLWDPAAASLAFDAIRSRVELEPDAELTLEANPGAAQESAFAAFRALGLNRLSIGVQSFDGGTLERLGRTHDAAQALAAVRAARAAGFDNVTIDLIYGAPGQMLEMARADADRAASLEPEHLSCYALTLENLAVEVPMALAVRSGRLRVPDDEAQWEMGRAVAERLEAAGYQRYEISNWARPGREARHNALYWTGGEYLGLGCGACGFALTDPADPSRGGRRWGNHRSPARWLQAVEAGELPETWSEELDAAALLRERLVMGLRMTRGVDVAEACAPLRLDPGPTLASARQLVERGLARLDGTRLALTERGLDFHTEAALTFV